MLQALGKGIALGVFVEAIKAGSNTFWTYVSPTQSTLNAAVNSKLPAEWRDE